VAEMDQGIKRLLQTHPRDVLALVMPGAEYVDTLPIDVATEPQLVLDTLFRVRYQGVECAVDLESEARPRPDIGRRLFEYGARAMIVTGLPVISVVLWLEPDGVPPASPFAVSVGDRPITTWHFNGIELYRLPAETLLATGPAGALPLVPFCAGGQELAIITRAAEIIQAQAPAPEFNELEALLAVFGARAVGNATMLAIIRRLGMSTEILETSPLYQEWIRKATQEGLQRGIEQGIEQGRRAAVVEVLQARLGALPSDILQAIIAADVETITQLLIHAGSDTLVELRARLGLSPA
jgi:predicted transposase YdaD